MLYSCFLKMVVVVLVATCNLYAAAFQVLPVWSVNKQQHRRIRSSSFSLGYLPVRDDPEVDSIIMISDKKLHDETIAFFDCSRLNNMLDRNGDGKIDSEDFHYLMKEIVEVLDANGDGVVDYQDVELVLSNIKDRFSDSVKKAQWSKAWKVICFAVILSLSAPGAAIAKGGGHGGGGGGGHGSTSGHSHSSPPPYRRHKKHPNRQDVDYLNPMACPGLPVLNEHLQVLEENGHYKTAIVTSVNEKSCSFTASGEGLHNSHKSLNAPRNLEAQIFPLFFLGAYVAGVFEQGFEDTAWDETFDADILTAKQRTNPGSTMPLSGTYIGSTSESDGMFQDVSTSLVFSWDGQVRGEGRDGEDGPYTVKGEWVKNLVTWTERYKGFAVTVKGRIKPTGSIYCHFVSDRGVRGTFKLRRQK